MVECLLRVLNDIRDNGQQVFKINIFHCPHGRHLVIIGKTIKENIIEKSINFNIDLYRSIRVNEISRLPTRSVTSLSTGLYQNSEIENRLKRLFQRN